RTQGHEARDGDPTAHRVADRTAQTDLDAVSVSDVRSGRAPDDALAADLVVKLHLPAPLFAVVGVPPGFEDAGLAAGEEHQPADVVVRRPSILERDHRASPHQEAHRSRLLALQPFTFRDTVP